MSSAEQATAPRASDAAPVRGAADLRSRLRLERRLESLPLIVALLLVVVIFQALTGLFLNPRNLVNLLTELAPLGFIAMASTVMIVMGEIDLSLGSLAGFTCAVLAALLAHDGVPWPAAVLLAFLVGVGISGLQGLIVVVGRVRSFAVTLAGYLVWYGSQLAMLGITGYIPLQRAPINELSLARIPEPVSLAIVGIGGAAVILLWLFGQRNRATRPAGTALAVRVMVALAVIAALLWAVTYLEKGGGVPLVFVLLILAATALWIMLTRTALGRHMYAVGGDLHAARESGIAINKVKWIGFAVAGALATCAGIAILSYTGGADSSAGTGALLLAGIGATVVGGVSLTGGRGSLWGAFGGAILLEAVGNGLNLMSLSFYAVFIVEGLVVLAALLTDAALRRRLITR
jgi:ABC-type xylose transport system permease subunit